MYSSLQELNQLEIKQVAFWRQPHLSESVIPERNVQFRNEMPFYLFHSEVKITEPEFNPVFQPACNTTIPKTSNAVYSPLLLFR